MNSLAVLLLLLLFPPVSPRQEAGPKSRPKSCVIASRHRHKFGENMSRVSPHKGLDYVEGEYPNGIKFHSELSDKLVRQIQEKGGRVVIVKPEYSQTELE